MTAAKKTDTKRSEATHTPGSDPFPASMGVYGHPLLDALTTLRIARDRWLTSKRETNARRDRAVRWMEQEPLKRSIGEATAYVGLAEAMDDQKHAKKVVLEAVDSLLHLGFDLEARKAGQP